MLLTPLLVVGDGNKARLANLLVHLFGRHVVDVILRLLRRRTLHKEVKVARDGIAATRDRLLGRLNMIDRDSLDRGLGVEAIDEAQRNVADGPTRTTSRTWPVPERTAERRSNGVPSITMVRKASRVPDASSRLMT